MNKNIVNVLILFLLLALGIFFAFTNKPRETKILLVGDMMFDRQIRNSMDTKGADFILSCSTSTLQSYDLVVGNLEGPITDNPSTSLGSTPGSLDNFVFTFPPKTADLLSKNNILLVNLGNNHIGNFGNEGIKSTKEYLDKAGVKYFGGLAGSESIQRVSFGKTNISFISYNQFGGEDKESIAKKIKEEKTSGNVVIIYTHWGEEYVVPTAGVREIAKLFADNGADLIIGSHPHVVQESEMIGKTKIYYSLGNFVFDQYWYSEVSTGLAVEAIIKNPSNSSGQANIQTKEYKVNIERGGRTCIDTTSSPTPTKNTDPQINDTPKVPETNSKSDLIVMDSPKINEVITSPVRITGKARGFWFFEASFPISIVDWNGVIIGQGIATAKSDWMTTDFVPFEATIAFDKSKIQNNYSTKGAIILKKDNPSGLPQYDDALEIPVVFK